METSTNQEISKATLNAEMANILLDDLLKERRSEKRWRWIKRILISGSALAITAAIMVQQFKAMGITTPPRTDHVAIVNLTGEVGSPNAASAKRLLPLLEQVFDNQHVKAIYLNIDSSGGSPIDSERIAAMLDAKKTATGKPVYAVINSIGASAAYMVAAHADKIYSGRYSLVGSIGAILQGWDFHQAMEERKIFQRVYSSGNLKGLMNPYAKMPEGGEEKAQALVDQMGREFANEVKALRGDKLSQSVDLFSGEVWYGLDAHALGLVDEIGTLESVITASYDLPKFDYGPANKTGSFLNLELVADVFVGSLLKGLGIYTDHRPKPSFVH